MPIWPVAIIIMMCGLSFRTYHCSFTHSSDWYKLANKSAATSSVQQQPSSLVMTRLLTLRETLDHLLRRGKISFSSSLNLFLVQKAPVQPSAPHATSLVHIGDRVELVARAADPAQRGVVVQQGRVRRRASRTDEGQARLVVAHLAWALAAQRRS